MHYSWKIVWGILRVFTQIIGRLMLCYVMLTGHGDLEMVAAAVLLSMPGRVAAIDASMKGE